MARDTQKPPRNRDQELPPRKGDSIEHTTPPEQGQGEAISDRSATSHEWRGTDL